MEKKEIEELQNLEAEGRKAIYQIMAISKMSKLASNNINSNAGDNSLTVEEFEEVFSTIELLGKEALKSFSSLSDKLDL